MNVSKFYLFNIGIPSLLDRLLLSSNFTELYSNIYNLVI